MDDVTHILDLVHDFECPWEIYTNGPIRNPNFECPIAAAHHVAFWRSQLGVRDSANFKKYSHELDIPDHIADMIAASADTPEAPLHVPGLTDYTSLFNPFLRDRLCLELVGGAK